MSPEAAATLRSMDPHDHGLSSFQLTLLPCDETNRRPRIQLESERGVGIFGFARGPISDRSSRVRRCSTNISLMVVLTGRPEPR